MKKIFNKIVSIVANISLLIGTLIPLARPAPAYASTAWSVGDVFVGVSSGSYKVYGNAGVFKETISDGLGGGVFDYTTGCAFNNTLDKLYTTYFAQTKVKVYDDAIPHTLSSTIDTGAINPGGQSESIVFAANGDFYVGHPDGNDDIQKYSSAGVYLTSYDVPIESRGSDWMDLDSFQTTMYYTSEGRLVKKYDVSGVGAPLPDFAVLPGAGTAFALRLLPPGDGSGGLLVADNSEVKKLDGTGAVVATYDVMGEDTWFSLNLDPDGTSFWAGNYGTGKFYKFDIATPGLDTHLLSVDTGVGSSQLFGICLKGEPTAAQVQITLDPPTDVNAAGTNHTVRATITVGGKSVVGEQVNFSVTAGPNVGQVSDPGECSVDPNCMTDAAGQTSWTYTSNGVAGTDTIQACFSDKSGKEHCAEAEKEWVDKTPPEAACTESVNPHGKKIPPAGSTTLPGSRGGQNEDGFYLLEAEDDSGLPVEIVVMNLSGSFTSAAYLSGTTVKITEAPGAIPSEKPMGSSNGLAGAVASHITLDSDAVVVATDAAGNETRVTCFVPPPPK